MSQSKGRGCPLGHHKAKEVKHGSDLINTLPFPVILLDDQGLIKSLNENVVSLLGYEEAEVKGKKYLETFHREQEINYALMRAAKALNRPEKHILDKDFWRWVVGTGEVYEQEWVFETKSGVHLSASGRFAPVSGSGNIIVSFFDISNYKSIIQELGDAELKTRMVFETAVDGFITITDRGIVQAFNNAAERLFGYSAKEVIGSNVKMLMPSEIAVKHDGYLKNYKETRKASIIGKGREVVGQRKDGSQFPMYLSVGEGQLSNGQTLYTGIVRDLTEYKKSEEELKKTNEKLEIQNRIKTDVATVVNVTRGTNDLAELASSAIRKLAETSGSSYGTFYVRNLDEEDDMEFLLLGTYAFTFRKHVIGKVKSGEGILGQVILERKTIILTNVPKDHVTIETSLGESSPNNLIVVPVLFEGMLLGLFELASFQVYGQKDKDFFEQTATAFAPNIHSALSHQKTKKLLENSQRLSQELTAQQEELSRSNEALENQKEQLKRRNEEMEAQQEELRQANEEMQLKEEELRKANEVLREREEELRQNIEAQRKLSENLQDQKVAVEEVNGMLKQKARELERTSAFKSQFLANMSHELRTPLNSLLIMAKLLYENREGNLSSKQIEGAQVIHNSGTELLNLINDILDLAKVESGKMNLQVQQLSVDEICSYVENSFKILADQKKLFLKVKKLDGVPETFVSDEMKLKQILKNFLSNAFKFTEKGGVTFKVSPLGGDRICFEVQDTGIGIPVEKQEEVFEAFKQVDGSIQRKYGGTGLGMTISKEYASLLQGEIVLESEEGEGTSFGLILPLKVNASSREVLLDERQERALTPMDGNQIQQITSVQPVFSIKLEDDKGKIDGIRDVVLIVEDDTAFAKVLIDLAHDHRFQAIHTAQGGSALNLAKEYKPRAIILDLFLPDCHGYTVLEKLKRDRDTRSIPVNIVSFDPNREETIGKGAISVLKKPVSEEEISCLLDQIQDKYGSESRKFLLVEDNQALVESLKQFLSEYVMDVASSAEQALEKLSVGENYACIIMDLGLPDSSGNELIKTEKFKALAGKTPIVIYTGRELSREESRDLEMLSKRIILKDGKSFERLKEELSLFFNEAVSVDEQTKKAISNAKESDLSLEGKRILIVDDDVRNIFALTSYLEVYGMEILYAESGGEALDILKKKSGVDAVLMDIMMPGMDGFTAIRRIRQEDGLQEVPIIALTAKAMKGDREECIHAGASDYISKPVDTEKLISLLKVWISKAVAEV